MSASNPHPNTLSLPSVEHEARAFWRVRLRTTTTRLKETMRASRLRVAIVVVLSGLLWLALFWMCVDGFRFMRATMQDQNLYEKITQQIFGTFFITLAGALLISSSIILYGAMFRGRDISMLLALPIRTERLFLHKFQEAVYMSSWAFLLLATPLLLAYGMVNGAPWYYYALLLPYLISFVFIPSAVGAVVCLLLVRFIPRGVLVLLGIVGLIALVALGLAAWRVSLNLAETLLSYEWLNQVLHRLEITQFRFLPTWWLSQGLLDTAAGKSHDGMMFFILLTSNALLLRMVAARMAAWLYRPAFSRMAGHRNPRRRGGGKLGWMDRVLLGLTAPFSQSIRLLLLKDFRLFRRDPIQWTQLLVFGVLLILYFVNLSWFDYARNNLAWINLVSFLNLSVVGLLLSTFTTRFIFPLVSLEGRRFWILGLLPIHRDTILWSKFLLAVGGSLGPCCLLVLLSDTMLGVDPLIVASHQLTCVILCLSLSGIAVGLGAKIPNFREESPSRIAAGFGGTLNLVLSTMLILLVVLWTAVPCHFYLATSQSATGGWSGRARLEAWLDFWLLGGTIASIVLGLLATWIPMHLGLRAFRQVEF